MKPLYLQLRRGFFLAVLAGEKRIEYRDASPHYDRMLSRPYDAVRFRNGYSPRAPEMVVAVRRIRKRGAMWCIYLGTIISINDETRAMLRKEEK